MARCCSNWRGWLLRLQRGVKADLAIIYYSSPKGLVAVHDYHYLVVLRGPIKGRHVE
jgi:hypothetical protein